MACVAVGLGCGGRDPSGSDPLADVAAALGDVRGADDVRHGATDDAGNRLDSLEIAQAGRGGFIGVHHVQRGRSFDLHVASSGDLLAWTHRAVLDSDAHQGALARAPWGGWLVAYEKSSPRGNSLRVRWYRSTVALLAARHDAEARIRRTLGRTAEGTPSIERVEGRSVESSTIELGFHYFRDRRVDRQARGVLERFSAWRPERLEDVDADFRRRGAEGHIGDRDPFELDGRRLVLHEAQLARDDASTWRLWLRDPDTGGLARLPVRTEGGSRAFGNPSAAVVEREGGRALVLTAFVFDEGAAPGEAGELIAVFELPR